MGVVLSPAYGGLGEMHGARKTVAYLAPRVTRPTGPPKPVAASSANWRGRSLYLLLPAFQGKLRYL